MLKKMVKDENRVTEIKNNECVKYKSDESFNFFYG